MPAAHEPYQGSPRGSEETKPSAVQEPQETRVPPLGRKDPLEEGMAARSSILAWGVLCAPGAWQVQSRRSQRVGHTWSDLASTHAQEPCSSKTFYLARTGSLKMFKRACMAGVRSPACLNPIHSQLHSL